MVMLKIKKGKTHWYVKIILFAVVFNLYIIEIFNLLIKFW